MDVGSHPAGGHVDARNFFFEKRKGKTRKIAVLYRLTYKGGKADEK